jgi:hypothetical protein
MKRRYLVKVIEHPRYEHLAGGGGGGRPEDVEGWAGCAEVAKGEAWLVECSSLEGHLKAPWVGGATGGWAGCGILLAAGELTNEKAPEDTDLHLFG